MRRDAGELDLQTPNYTSQAELLHLQLQEIKIKGDLK